MQFGFGAGSLYVTRSDIVGQPVIRFGAFQDLPTRIAFDSPAVPSAPMSILLLPVVRLQH